MFGFKAKKGRNEAVNVIDKPLKRPRDPAQLAKLMIDIASGEVEDRAPDVSTSYAERSNLSVTQRRSKTTRIRLRCSRCTIISSAFIRRFA